MSLFRYFGVLYVIIFLFLTGSPAQTKTTDGFSSPLHFCGEDLWQRNVNYHFASDNQLTFYTSDSEIRNQLIKFSIKDKNIFWKTTVEGEISAVLELSELNEVQVLSSSISSLFITRINAESGVTISQAIFLKTNFNVLTSINKKEFILINKLSLVSYYFGRAKIKFENFDLLDKNSNNSLFQIFGEKIYLLDGNKLTAVNLRNPSERRTLLLNKESVITEFNISKEVLSVGFNNGDVLTFSTDLRMIWKIKTGGKIRFIKETDVFTLVISDDNFIYLFTKKNGGLVWKFRNKSRLLFAPSIIDGNIVIFDILESNLKILSLKNGFLINQLFFEEGRKPEGQIIYENQKLYLLLPDRILYFSLSKC